MQRLFIILFLLTAVPALGQNNNVPEKNNNTLNTNGVFTSNGNAAAIDSVKYEDKEIQVIESKKPMPRMETQKGAKKTEGLREAGKEAAPAVQQSVEEESFEGKDEALDTPAPAAIQMQQQFESNQFNANHQLNRRSASSYEQMNMDASVDYYKAVTPNSFESHFYTYLAGHYDTSLFDELEAAAALQPENVEVQKQLAAYHIITRNPEEALPVIQGLIDNGTVTAGQLAYANDLLVSGDTGSVMILHGFNDMFATYYIQNNNAVRTDLGLLSLDFMQSETYRDTWAGEGFVLPESTVIDTAYLASFCQLNAASNVQLSMKEHLYPVGLTFRYSETPFDNYAVNHRLWSETMQLGEVRKPASGNACDWCTNYLPMLVTLRKQAEAQHKKEEVKALNSDILQIGSRSNTTDKVKKYTK
jgi:hypothetical protein